MKRPRRDLGKWSWGKRSQTPSQTPTGRGRRWPKWRARSDEPTQLTPHGIDWVLPEQLAIGPAPPPDALPYLLEQRIAVILSLCDEQERSLPESFGNHFCCLRIPLPDSRYARSLEVEELSEAVDLIHWHRLKHRPVYVHCLAGIERSPLVCLAYLCRYCQMDLFEALGWLQYVHPPTQPRSNQLGIVRQYLNAMPSTNTTA